MTTNTMTNRQKLIERLKAGVSEYLQEELEHFMDVDDREYEYDLADAFFDAESRAENLRNRKVITECRKIMIEMGAYIPMTQSDIESTAVSSGTAWCFKLNGIPYRLIWSYCGGEKFWDMEAKV